MREIEVKARAQDLQALKANLTKRGVVFGQPIKHHDVVYAKRDGSERGWANTWLRIRTENDDTVIFTFKKSVNGQLDSIEHEVTVDSADELSTIIAHLGFELYSDLTKTRTKGKLGDIEICLDTIEGLGEFIEAELLVQDDAAEAANAETKLQALFTKLGITAEDRIYQGYDSLQRQARSH